MVSKGPVDKENYSWLNFLTPKSIASKNIYCMQDPFNVIQNYILLIITENIY